MPGKLSGSYLFPSLKGGIVVQSKDLATVANHLPEDLTLPRAVVIKRELTVMAAIISVVSVFLGVGLGNPFGIMPPSTNPQDVATIVLIWLLATIAGSMAAAVAGFSATLVLNRLAGRAIAPLLHELRTMWVRVVDIEEVMPEDEPARLRLRIIVDEVDYDQERVADVELPLAGCAWPKDRPELREMVMSQPNRAERLAALQAMMGEQMLGARLPEIDYSADNLHRIWGETVELQFRDRPRKA
jgi:hypothetical protein